MLAALASQPALGGTGYTLHVGILGVLLQFENFLLTHHIALFHGFLKIAHAGQRIIGVVVAVLDKPAAAGKRGDELGIGGAFSSSQAS